VDRDCFAFFSASAKVRTQFPVQFYQPSIYHIVKQHKTKDEGDPMGYYIKVDQGVNLYVEDLNPSGKKTILLIHGWPGNHNLFEYQLNTLPKLGFRCVAMDCRGFGLSDKPWDGYDYNRLSDDVKAIIDALQLNNVILCGHSTGGAICIRYMARHSNYKVAKLALFAAAAPSLIQRPDFPFGIQKQAVLNIIQGTYKDRPKMLRDFGGTIFFRRVSPALSDWIFQLGLQAANWSTSAIANMWINEVLFDDLGKINVPTLILHGLNDRVCLYPLAVAQNKGIKNSKLVPFRQCGHFLFYDQMDKFNKELIEFTRS
jgi:non-heme chloroperoxidase